MSRLLPILLLCACVDRALDYDESSAPVSNPAPSDAGTPLAHCAQGSWRRVALPNTENMFEGAVAVTQDRVHIVYGERVGAQDLLAHLSAPLGTTTWQVEKLMATFGTPRDIGLAVAPDGSLVLRYVVISNIPNTTGFVVAGRQVGGAWTFTAGPDMKTPGGDRTLAVDSAGIAHGTASALDGGLLHFAIDGSGAVTSDRVADGAGFAAVTAIGPDGVVRIAYADPSEQVNIASRSGAGWQVEGVTRLSWSSKGLGYIASEVAFAIDRAGDWHLGYLDSSSPFSYMKKSGSAWSLTTAPVAPDGSLSDWKTFFAGPDGDVYAAFQSGHNYTATVARLGDTKIDIVDKSSEAASFAIARDAAGGTHVVYYGFEDTELHYAYKCP